MSKIRELSEADIARLKIEVAQFAAGILWPAMRSTMGADRERIIADLADKDIPAEKLKFAQGELAQANRDIMLVERFLRALDGELQRRQRAQERT